MIPLSGIKVLDLSRLLPGPLASLVLADLGAEVDKIEDSTGGDYLRAMPPHVGDERGAAPTSSVFLALNRNKRSAVVNLKKPEATDMFLRLVRSYDVVLEQFRPGVLARLGLSHQTLLEANPRLVVCALTGYGQTGPLAARAGHDLNYLARAGVLGFQGPTDRPPAVPGFQLADVSGGLYAVIGIMGALMERAETGQGQVVDVAMVETAMPFAIAGFGLAFGGKSPARGDEALIGAIAPYQTYATKDGGAMALASLEPKFWMQFCAGVGREAEMSDLVPGPHQAALKDELRRVFAEKTRDEWIAFASEQRLLPRAGAHTGRSAQRFASRRTERLLRARLAVGNHSPDANASHLRRSRAHRAAATGRAHGRDPSRCGLCGRRDRKAPWHGCHPLTRDERRHSRAHPFARNAMLFPQPRRSRRE